MPALSACHSALQSFAVFAEAPVLIKMPNATAVAISRLFLAFIFILLNGVTADERLSGNDRADAAAETRASGRKEPAAAALFIAPIAFFDKSVFPIRYRL